MRSSSAITVVLVASATLLGCSSGSAGAPPPAQSSTATAASATSPSPPSNAQTTQAAPKLSISGNSTTITLQVTYSATPSFVRVFVDADQKATTGYPLGGIGADYLIENGYLYRYAGSAGSWAWTLIKTLSLTESNGVATWNVAGSDLGSPSGITAIGNYNSAYSSALSYTLAAAAAVINNFSFTTVPTQVTAGNPFSFSVTARDANNVVLTGYTGTVHFSSSDPSSPALPADYTFLSTDQGTKQLSATLKTAGNQTITVTQVAGGAPTATTPAINVASASAPPPPPPPPPTTTRDPLKWPFAATSIWNMPIGSGASYVASGLHFTTTPNSTEYWYDMPQSDHERLVLTPTAPLINVYISTVGWSGGNRCAASGGVFFAAPIPASYVVPNSTYNNGAAILLADGLSIVQTQPFTKCAGYSYATTMQVPWSLSVWEYNLQTGDGILGAHGGSELSTLGGTMRLGELRPGTQMRHALKVNVDSATSLGLCTGNFGACFRWPAATADGYAANSGSGYGSATNNTNSAMKMGALLAIPASVNINNIGLQSVPGQMLAWTLQNYGAYIVDSRGSPGFDFSIEDGAAGSKADEFQADYGFPFDGRLGYLTLTGSTGQPTPQAKWVSDIRLIIDYLAVVGNNSPTTIGGGGTPLQPLAPPFQ
jgi:hypothetical protein